MNANDLKQQLIQQARYAHACGPGLTKLCSSVSKQEIADCFLKYIDFCLANNYPDNTFLKLYFEQELENIGIYIDKCVTRKNELKSVFLGKCFGLVVADGYSVCRIWAKHESKINIHAYGNAKVMVDALDNADIVVDAEEEATVIVNLYSRATCTGATTIIYKKQETYEL